MAEKKLSFFHSGLPENKLHFFHSGLPEGEERLRRVLIPARKLQHTAKRRSKPALKSKSSCNDTVVVEHPCPLSGALLPSSASVHPLSSRLSSRSIAEADVGCSAASAALSPNPLFASLAPQLALRAFNLRSNPQALGFLKCECVLQCEQLSAMSRMA
jgi:hypothetical protein